MPRQPDDGPNRKAGRARLLVTGTNQQTVAHRVPERRQSLLGLGRAEAEPGGRRPNVARAVKDLEELDPVCLLVPARRGAFLLT